MKSKSWITHTDKYSKIITTLIVMLFLVFFLQSIIAFAEVVVAVAYFPEIWTQRSARSIKLTKEEKYLREIARLDKEILPDGSIHLVGHLGGRPRILDSNLNTIWQSHYMGDEIPYEYLSFTRFISENYYEPWDKLEMGVFPVGWRHIQAPVKVDGRIKELWRYRRSKGLFEGYRISGSKIGYIGKNGFVEESDKATPLELTAVLGFWYDPVDESLSKGYWATHHEGIEIEFKTRTIKTFYKSSGNITHFADMSLGYEKAKKLAKGRDILYRPLVCFYKEDGSCDILLNELDRKTSFSLPDHWDISNVRITATLEDIYLLYNGSEIQDEEENVKKKKKTIYHKWIELHKISENGRLEFVNRYEWTEPEITRSMTRDEYLWGNARDYVNVMSPSLYNLVRKFWPKDSNYYFSRIGPMVGFLELIKESLSKYVLINVIISLALSILVFRHSKLRRLPPVDVIVWIILVMLFNLAGFLAYLAIHHSPLIKCSTCGRKRGLVHPNCVHCGSALPMPQSRPTDII